jgi:hypothetical protein
MKKVNGFIPVQPGETITEEQGVATINGKLYKHAEVWVPGIVTEKEPDEVRDEQGNLISIKTDCGNVDVLHRATHFRAMASGQRCHNCAMTKDRHKGPNLMCPAKDEKPLPGMKYD